MGYFRQFYDADPTLLESKSNEDLIDQWKRDHMNYTDLDLKKARQNLANLKSSLRRKAREGARRSAPGSRMSAARKTNSYSGTRNNLETLEEQIDNCLLMARNMDPEGLADVIRHLRFARNEVVLKIG
jgi:hypothetical protein